MTHIFVVHSSLLDPPKTYRLSHPVSNHYKAVTMTPESSKRSLSPHRNPIYFDYIDRDEFISSPTIPRTHMPHRALKKQVRLALYKYRLHASTCFVWHQVKANVDATYNYHTRTNMPPPAPRKWASFGNTATAFSGALSSYKTRSGNHKYTQTNTHTDIWETYFFSF